mmetsp:Transcript_35994/g.93636  ORF Transcript_35994/g.93636 Transcript_35994/m.93636 type:complete len:736 (+) Transcript_35994:1006-3213(+)
MWEKHPEVAQALDYKPNDGSFWMSYKEFLKYFSTLYLCIQFPPGWSTHKAASQWKGKSAGGCPNNETWVNNPMFTLTVEETTQARMVLSQTDARMEKEGDDWAKYDNSIGFVVTTKKSFDESGGQFDKLAIVGDSGPYEERRDVSLPLRVDLKAEDSPFLIIPSAFKAGSEGDFIVSVHTATSSHLSGGELPLKTKESKPKSISKQIVKERKDKKKQKKQKEAIRERDVPSTGLDEVSVVAMCKAKQCKFEDPDFPATERSLFGDSEKPEDHIPADDIKWLRPEEFCPGEPQVFIEGVDPGDVIQGRLGDCWFLGALSTVALKPPVLQHLFIGGARHRKEFGVVTLQFYKDGRWVEVLIDDRIPCRKGHKRYKPIYASCKDPNELWVMLAEKAYAKLHSCYLHLRGGFLPYGVRDLTGGVPQDFRFRDDYVQTMIRNGELWRKVVDFFECGSFLGCSRSRKSKSESEADVANGVLAVHAYGITDVQEVEGFKLLRIRNPWGRKEWQGDWSDKSEKWRKYPAVKKTLNHEDKNDGTFWMAWEDVLEIFSVIEVCRLFSSDWNVVHRRGRWVGESAAGPYNSPWWFNNPMFTLRLPRGRKTKVFISLTQEDARMTKHWKQHNAAMAIVVTTEEQVKSGRRLHSEQLCAHSLPYTSSRDVSIMTVVELDGDHKYVAMPNTYSAGKEGEFLLSIYSSSKIRVKGGEDIEIDSALAVGSDYSDVEELGEVKEDIEEEDEG